MAYSAVPSIGGYQFIVFAGGADLGSPAMALEIITRPGLDGEAFRQLGLRGNTVPIHTEVDTNNPDLDWAGYQALQGTLQTVVCVDGYTVSNVAILNVQRSTPKRILSSVGGRTAGAWLLMANWILKPS